MAYTAAVRPLVLRANDASPARREKLADVTGGEGTRHLTVLHVVERLGGSGGAEMSLAALLPELEARGVHNIVLPLDGRSWPDHGSLRHAGIEILASSGAGLTEQIRGVRRAVRSFQPDLVHSCLWRADLVARLACYGIAPVLVSLVNTQYSTAARRIAPSPIRLDLHRRLDGLLARHATSGLHAITRAVAEESARALRVDAASIFVVPRGREISGHGGAMPDRLARRRGLGLPSDRPLVVNVARHEWQKGPEDLIDAWSTVVRRHPDALLVQAGRDGHATPALKARIAKRGLERNVRLLGVRSDVPALLSCADAFIFSSHWEGLGGSVLEAMSAGTPVAAYDVPAVAEVLDGCGLMVPVGSATELGAAVCRLLEDRDLASALARTARDRFRNRFTLDAVADDMATMYDSLCLSTTHGRRPSPRRTPG